MEKKPRAALIRPLCGDADPEFQEPLGAEAICGYLREHGAEATVFDRRLGAGLREISAYDPDWIGFSLMTDADAPDALRLLQLLRREGRRFFAGGLFVTTCPEQARALFPADTVLISGEGEGPVWELMTTGAVQGRLVPGPDEWAYASRDRMGEYLSRGGVINIRTSRGCRGVCTFCTTPRDGKPAGHEVRSTGKVADEMALMQCRGFEPVFNFTDDMFGDHERILALTEALSARHVKAAFSLEMRAQEVCRTPADLWERLHEGGLCRVFTGLESLNPDTLKAWRKPVRPAELLKSVGDMRRSGIACEIGYILWQEQTRPEDAQAEAEELHRQGLLSPKTALSRLVLFRGSQLYDARRGENMYLCRLQPDAAALYRKWETLLAGIGPLWRAAACAVPKLACEVFLHPEQRSVLCALEQCMTRIRDMTWQAISTGVPPSAEDCQKIRGNLIALHISGA